MATEKENILTYLKWHGDIKFSERAFNEVDAVILCQIGYMRFGDLVSESFENAVSFSELSEKIKNTKTDFIKYTDVGVMNPNTSKLFFLAAESKRFCDVKISAFASKYIRNENIEEQEQFAAMSFILDDKNVCIVFRGTDDSIVGMKEDFNMALLDEIPAQIDAQKYLKDAVEKFSDKNIIIAGHSKGGNLAIFATANLPSEKQSLVSAIYNNDGPGFSRERLDSDEYKPLQNIIHTFYPESSIVGMLFDHYENYNVVESYAVSILQHDLFSWKVDSDAFTKAAKLSAGSEFLCKTFNDWYVDLPQEKKVIFIDAMFAFLQNTGADNISGMIGDVQNSFKDAKLSNSRIAKTFKIGQGIIKGAATGIGSVVKGTKATSKVLLDAEIRNVVFEIGMKFGMAGISNIGESVQNKLLAIE